MFVRPVQSLLLILLLIATSANANSGIWLEIPENGTGQQLRGSGEAPNRYYEADDAALRSALALAPHETSGDPGRQIELPMPDGGLARFSVQESPVMAPGLAAKYPEIRTYRVQGVDDQSALGRIGISPLGFSGMIQTAAGRVFISPDDFKAQNHIYRSGWASRQAPTAFNCSAHGAAKDLSAWVKPRSRRVNRVSGSLQQYDIAVAASFEYYDLFDNPPTTGGTTAAITMTINQVNLVYERDLGIRLMLVANNDEIYETVNDNLLGNANELEVLSQANEWIDNNLTGGDAAYDIGHVFTRPPFGGGGVANIGAVCDDGFKAGGVSGLPNPFMNPAFDIDLVAHEIGHQFNAEHSFNGTTASCANRNAATAFEPGSGSSIMSYAGICASEDLQSNSDAVFHAGSIAQINAFAGGPAASCANLVATTPAGNNDPVINPVTDTSIPANTAFLLDASASDLDPNTLSYQWDQMDTGCPTSDATLGTDNGSNTLFRSHMPRNETWRNFPALGTQLQGLYDKAETLPCHNRDLDFRLTVRDGVSGQDTEDLRVSVTDSAGPFMVTDPNLPQALVAGTAFTVNWDVAGTDLAPVSCANVDIDLMTFSLGYASYSVYSLAAGIANNGSASVTINPPTSQHSRARIRVKCSDNIFYDLSDANMAITPVGAPTPLGDTDFVARSYANIVTTGIVAPACGAVVNCSPAVRDSGSGGGSSALNPWWLLLLCGSIAGLKLLRRQGCQ